MRTLLAGATGLCLTATTALVTAPVAAAERPPDDPVVVVDHLDNPRQLNWTEDHDLVVAEAGRGGDTCFGEGEERLCAGLTGAVTLVERPRHTEGAEPHRVVTGLLSVAGPDGSFVFVGPAGADATDREDEYVAVVGGVPPEAVPPEAGGLPGLDQIAHLVVAGSEGEESFTLPYADIAAAEAEQNPDGAQVESNPYAVLFVDVTSSEDDGYALVADAAANTVWKVEPDLASDVDGPPPYEITPWAVWPTLPDDETIPEYVPTSLATDGDGNVYVGGLGSEQPGAAVVTRFSPEGEELDAWSGFTAITGVAVDEHARHLYVSQLFGTGSFEDAEGEGGGEAPPDGVPGDVVRVDLEAGTHVSQPVPLPAGLAVDRYGDVFVAANSVAPAEGIAASEFLPEVGPGQVWELDWPKRGGDEAPLPVTGTPYPPADTGGEWVPAPADFYAPQSYSYEACGTHLFYRAGDVREVEYRATEQEESLLVEFRGAATADLLAQDGRVVDELDISGAGYELLRDDGSSTFSVEGPSTGITFPEEEAAYAAAGIPQVYYWQEGTFTQTVTADGEVVLEELPAEFVDVCTLLRPAG